MLLVFLVTFTDTLSIVVRVYHTLLVAAEAGPDTTLADSRRHKVAALIGWFTLLIQLQLQTPSMLLWPSGQSSVVKQKFEYVRTHLPSAA